MKSGRLIAERGYRPPIPSDEQRSWSRRHAIVIVMVQYSTNSLRNNLIRSCGGSWIVRLKNLQYFGLLDYLFNDK